MYEKLPELIIKSETVDRIGKIENVVGMSMEASGGRSGVGAVSYTHLQGTCWKRFPRPCSQSPLISL